jgi:hypothetical protein
MQMKTMTQSGKGLLLGIASLSMLATGVHAPSVARADTIGYFSISGGSRSDFYDYTTGPFTTYRIEWSAYQVGPGGANAAEVHAAIDDGGTPGDTGVRIYVHCSNWPLNVEVPLQTEMGTDAVETSASYKCDPGAGIEYFLMEYKISCSSGVWEACS